MSLQRRLILFFVVIVVIPLAVAGAVVQRLVVGEIRQRSTLALPPALDAVLALYNERASVLEELIESAVDPESLAEALESDDHARLDALLGDAVTHTRHLDFLVVTGPDDAVLGRAFVPGNFVEGFDAPHPEEIVRAGATGRGFAKSSRPLKSVAGDEVGTIIGGFWLDESLLVAGANGDVDVSLVAQGKVVATTTSIAGPVRVDARPRSAPFETTLDQKVIADARKIDSQGRAVIMASTPSPAATVVSTRVMSSIIGLLLIAAIGTTILAIMLARLITRPLEELARGADAISEGRFDYRIPVRSRDEVGRLALAFNEMTEKLRHTVTELQDSRDLLQRAVRRVGETLRSTHDMTQMLEAIIDTAVDAVEADAAVLWRFTPTRNELYPASVRGLDEEDASRVRVGEGVAGLVAERATTVMVPSNTQLAHPSRNEPPLPVVAAVPLYSKDRVTGVISVHRRDPSRPFTEEDLDAIVFLIEQGSVAIENVLLHEEARRLSLTDGLTGVYNRRYFQMQFRQLLATAVRFDRPFSVLMLDLDQFKRVNDTYGHQRGDTILVEFSQRVSGVLREVDTFARYGGEEFIALLSETALEGALSTANKILDVIRSQPFVTEGEAPVNLTVSVGVACYPEHGDSFSTLVEAADQALYTAKQQGRDRAAIADTATGLRLA